jgi:hypothetical protein
MGMNLLPLGLPLTLPLPLWNWEFLYRSRQESIRLHGENGSFMPGDPRTPELD